MGVAYISYGLDTGTLILPVFDGTPQQVNNKWETILGFAGAYGYAEQHQGPPFQQWPFSYYLATGTNSNTFIRWLVGASGLQMVEFPGQHPGNFQPEINLPGNGGKFVGLPF